MNIKDQKVTRQLQADVQQQNSQVVFSFATQTPYLRQSEVGQYYEILKCQPQYVDDSRLKDDGCQLLLDHNWERTVGVLKKYWFANGKLYASCKFSKSQFAQGIKRDVLDMIRRNVSIGYIVKDYQVVDSIDGIKTIEVTNWEPYEVSIVSVPADINAGYLRSLEKNTEEAEEGKDTQMKNAKNNKTDSTELVEQTELERKETDVDLENKDLAGEDLESKSEETTEVEEEVEKEKQLEQKEICPECNKPLDQCQCEKACDGDKEEKACGEEKPEEKKLEPTVDELRVALEKSLEADAAEIRSLGEIVKDSEAAEKFVAEHKTLDQFKTYLKNKDSKKSNNSIQDNNKMEKKYFSVSKLINAIRTNTVDTDSYEFKTNEENKRALGIDNQRSVFLTKSDLSYNAMYRAYADGFGGTLTGTGIPNGGDTLIQFQYRPDMYATNLRPQLTLEKTGYKDVTSVDGRPIEWPVCVSGINAAMVDLDGNLPSTSMGWKNIRLQGKKIGGIAYIPYSLLSQAAPQADAIIEEDLIKDLYQIRDTKVFTGVGTTSSAYEPLGILNNAEVNQVSTSGFTWADFVDAEVKIREANDFSENLAWVMSPKTYGTLRATAKNAGNNGFVYGFICEDEKIGRYPVYCNPAIPDDKVILGNFNELVICDFAGLQIVLDPYTGLQNNQVRGAGWIQMDATLQRPKSFTVITKS